MEYNKIKDFPSEFLSYEQISHTSVQFEYIKFLHRLLWKIAEATSLFRGGHLNDFADELPHIIGRLTAERDALKAENARLCEALEKIANADISVGHPNPMDDIDMQYIARQALEGSHE